MKTYTITRADGTTIELTANEVSLLMNQMQKDTLRSRIEDAVNDMDGDTIDMSKYEYTREEFIDEIFLDLEDEIDYGNFVSDDDITDKITDTADFYEMCID